jgi:hypothetical protein
VEVPFELLVPFAVDVLWVSEVPFFEVELPELDEPPPSSPFRIM